MSEPAPDTVQFTLSPAILRADGRVDQQRQRLDGGHLVLWRQAGRGRVLCLLHEALLELQRPGRPRDGGELDQRRGERGAQAEGDHRQPPRVEVRYHDMDLPAGVVGHLRRSLAVLLLRLASRLIGEVAAPSAGPGGRR